MPPLWNTRAARSPSLRDGIPAAFTVASASGRHHGLGLTLCRRLVQFLGGTLDITIADGHFTVHVVLPGTAI